MSLADFHGKKVILYFYPRMKPRMHQKRRARSATATRATPTPALVVLGCSVDSADAHKDFIRKNSLPFPLLLDPTKNRNRLRRRERDSDPRLDGESPT